MNLCTADTSNCTDPTDKMDEFIENKRKVLKIENPISLFTNLFSLGVEAVNKRKRKNKVLTFILENGEMAKFEHVNGDK